MHPDDLGKVIGRGGRTAKALRQVMTGVGGRACGSTSSTPTGAEHRLRSERPCPSTPWWSAASAGPTVCVVEVTVEVRTDDPDLRFAPGAVLRTDPPERGPADRRRRARGTAARCCCSWPARTGGVDAREAAEALRNTLLLVAGRRPPRDRGPRLLLRPPAGRPDRAARPTARRSARSPASGTRRQDLLVVRRADGGEVLVPFVSAIVPTVDLAGGLRRRGSARGPASTCDGLRIDVVTIFPEYLAPLRQSLLGKAVERGLVDVARARPAAVDRRRAPHRRRLPVRRRPRHGHAARAVGPGAGRRPARRAPGWSCPPRPAGRSPRRSPPSGRPSRGWSSPAAATRASTSGSPTGPPTPGRSPRSRSATTCWPAASPRCW